MEFLERAGHQRAKMARNLAQADEFIQGSAPCVCARLCLTPRPGTQAELGRSRNQMLQALNGPRSPQRLAGRLATGLSGSGRQPEKN